MTGKRIRLLAVVVAGLVLAIPFLTRYERGNEAAPDRQLLQAFATHANAAKRISVVAGDNEPIIVRRESGQWVVGSRDDYPADSGKLRQVMVALASARILEEKTSNPDRYEKLEIADPPKAGGGTLITVDGEGFSYSVIVGKQVQSDRRYVRVAGTEQGYLIDQNPKIPQDIAGWLLPDIVDIGAKRVRKITISHTDGETIRIEKTAEELTDFAVLDIPQGRELSYASVGNGIAGVLSKLDLEDVRAVTDVTPTSSAVIQTWDGLRITITISTNDQASWLTFVADENVKPVTDKADNNPAADADTAVIHVEVSELNEHLGAWQFKISDYKKDLLTKRWEDILKPLESSSK